MPNFVKRTEESLKRPLICLLAQSSIQRETSRLLDFSNMWLNERLHINAHCLSVFTYLKDKRYRSRLGITFLARAQLDTQWVLMSGQFQCAVQDMKTAWFTWKAAFEEERGKKKTFLVVPRLTCGTVIEPHGQTLHTHYITYQCFICLPIKTKHS